MKLRKNSTREFCVTRAPRLGAVRLHKMTHFGFVRFQKTHSIENFSIAVHSKPFKIILIRSNEIRSVGTSRCLARDQNLP